MRLDLAGLCFLDFDGVLNRIVPGAGYVPPHPGLDRDCVEGVARLVKRFKLGVVVSSSWREVYTIPVLQGHLRLAGGDAIANRLIGTTPMLPGGEVPKRPGVRGREVALALEVYSALWPRPFVVIDDSGKHGFPEAFFVQTVGRLGFTQEDYARCAAVLAAQGVQ